MRSAAFHAYREATRLRYPHDEALERAADAIHALLPPPKEGEVSYENLEYDLTVTEEKLSETEDEVYASREIIRCLREELSEANARISDLAQKAHTNDFY